MPKKWIYIAGLVLFISPNSSAQTKNVSEFAPGDPDRAFSLAMMSIYDTLIIDSAIKDWVLQPMHFTNVRNKTIVIEPGVRIKAKAGVFRDVNDALFKFTNAEDVSILGHANVLSMNKDEYTDGEWRHVLSFRGCKNIVVDNLTLRDSGGDGIYISGSGKNVKSENITISRIHSLNNKRQGISIISASGVYVSDSEFSETKGTLPGAGVDIEPDEPSDVINSISFVNCVFRNNFNAGIKIELWKLTSASAPVDIVFTDCLLQNNHSPENPRTPAEISIGAHKTDPVKGVVVFRKCLVENSLWGLLYSRKGADAFQVSFQDCSAVNICSMDKMPPILLEVADYRNNSPDLGGFEFRNTYFKLNKSVPVFVVRGSRFGTLNHLRNISGTITYSGISRDSVKYINYDPVNNIDVRLRLTKK